jgi:hypothetical protein|tara:strand:+ start:476 stop:634 length:159 start_codon:yes stop_codon:yes gene_type:complete
MSKQWHGGKGDKSRSINNEKYANNWDSIFKANEVIEGREQLPVIKKKKRNKL